MYHQIREYPTYLQEHKEGSDYILLHVVPVVIIVRSKNLNLISIEPDPSLIVLIHYDGAVQRQLEIAIFEIPRRHCFDSICCLYLRDLCEQKQRYRYFPEHQQHQQRTWCNNSHDLSRRAEVSSIWIRGHPQHQPPRRCKSSP